MTIDNPTLTREIFKELADSALDGIIMTDVTLQIIYANRAAHAMFGYTEEELIGQNATIIWPEEDLPRLQTFMPQIMTQGWSGEARNKRKDGTLVVVSSTAFPMGNPDNGLPATLAVILRDITEHKQVEEAMRDSEARYSAVVTQAKDGVIILQDNYCQFVNQALADMLGYTPNEMENTPVIRYIAPESRELVANRIKARLAGQEVPPVYEANLLRKDGMVIEAELSAGVIQYRGKAADVGLIRDISERKRIQAEREHLQQGLIEAQRQAIQELSTPIIPVMDQIIVMPLIGSIDSLRAQDITRTLLAGIRENRAKVVILDITGVLLVDSGVANHLNKTIQAARLKGARTIITGVSDAVAETIVDLGIDWSGIETLADLRTGLMVALNSLGLKLSKV